MLPANSRPLGPFLRPPHRSKAGGEKARATTNTRESSWNKVLEATYCMVLGLILRVVCDMTRRMAPETILRRLLKMALVVARTVV